MKYFEAFVHAAEKITHTHGEDPTKPIEPVSSVLSGPPSTMSEKIDSSLAEASRRNFLSRPLGQEDNPDPWDAWDPFMLWLLEHHPQHYHAICDAEDLLNSLERQGITKGASYEDACTELKTRFETARKLKMRKQAKVWFE